MNNLQNQLATKEAVKSKFKGKKKITSKHPQRYPASAEREMQRVVNAYMQLFGNALKKHLPSIMKSYEKNVTYARYDDASGFRATEIGVFIQDPEDETAEKLYAYGFIDSEQAQYIPANTDYPFETTESVMVFVGDMQNVSAILSSSLTAVTQAEFEEHTGDNNNPHNVSAQQVGLGNVPNVSTDDQTPTVDASNVILNTRTGNPELPNSANLQPGDTLRTIVGKVGNAIATLISHIRATNNPHQLTPTTIGAANRNHTHSASDITSGMLSVERGGTGVNSIARLESQLSFAKCQTGSYTGGGTYGTGLDGRFNTLSFNGSPQMLTIIPANAANGDGFSIVRGMTRYQNTTKKVDIYVVWHDRSVEWYSTVSAEKQYNVENATYNYSAILQ